MLTHETTDDIPLIGQKSWEDQLGNIAITAIEGLGLRPETTHQVWQGSPPFDWTPGSGIEAVASDGFSNCAAIIGRYRGEESCVVDHTPPADYLSWKAFNERGPLLEEVVVVLGSESGHQTEIVQALAGHGVKVRQLIVETGRPAFGAVFYPLAGKVSIVRRAPNHSILEYQLFQPIQEQ